MYHAKLQKPLKNLGFQGDDGRRQDMQTLWGGTHPEAVKFPAVKPDEGKTPLSTFGQVERRDNPSDAVTRGNKEKTTMTQTGPIINIKIGGKKYHGQDRRPVVDVQDQDPHQPPRKGPDPRRTHGSSSTFGFRKSSSDDDDEPKRKRDNPRDAPVGSAVTTGQYGGSEANQGSIDVGFGLRRERARDVTTQAELIGENRRKALHEKEQKILYEKEQKILYEKEQKILYDKSQDVPNRDRTGKISLKELGIPEEKPREQSFDMTSYPSIKDIQKEVAIEYQRQREQERDERAKWERKYEQLHSPPPRPSVVKSPVEHHTFMGNPWKRPATPEVVVRTPEKVVQQAGNVPLAPAKRLYEAKRSEPKHHHHHKDDNATEAEIIAWNRKRSTWSLEEAQKHIQDELNLETVDPKPLFKLGIAPQANNEIIPDKTSYSRQHRVPRTITPWREFKTVDDVNDVVGSTLKLSKEAMKDHTYNAENWNIRRLSGRPPTPPKNTEYYLRELEDYQANEQGAFNAVPRQRPIQSTAEDATDPSALTGYAGIEMADDEADEDESA
jgi:hypothetical protein